MEKSQQTRKEYDGNIKKYGLSHSEMAQVLTRKIGVERIEIVGRNYKIVNNDNVLELNPNEKSSRSER